VLREETKKARPAAVAAGAGRPPGRADAHRTAREATRPRWPYRRSRAAHRV